MDLILSYNGYFQQSYPVTTNDLLIYLLSHMSLYVHRIPSPYLSYCTPPTLYELVSYLCGMCWSDRSQLYLQDKWCNFLSVLALCIMSFHDEFLMDMHQETVNVSSSEGESPNSFHGIFFHSNNVCQYSLSLQHFY